MIETCHDGCEASMRGRRRCAHSTSKHGGAESPARLGVTVQRSHDRVRDPRLVTVTVLLSSIKILDSRYKRGTTLP